MLDVIPLAFLYVFFGIGGEPMIDFANVRRRLSAVRLSTLTDSLQICSTDANSVFPGTQLANCSAMGPDIELCQSKGKIVTLSLGGADSSVGFTNSSQAQGFADQIWNQFLGGQSSIRPFGSVVLDG